MSVIVCHCLSLTGCRHTHQTPHVKSPFLSKVDFGAVIRLQNVTKIYPASKRPALDGVNVEIDKGEFVFLIGPSGSGKSTFLRLLIKEETPTKGIVSVAGKDLTKMSNWKVPALRRTMGCVFQDFRLLPNKTVYHNVAFALQVIGKPRRFIRKEIGRAHV